MHLGKLYPRRITMKENKPERVFLMLQEGNEQRGYRRGISAKVRFLAKAQVQDNLGIVHALTRRACRRRERRQK